jgi:hypothetical protein
VADEVGGEVDSIEEDVKKEKREGIKATDLMKDTHLVDRYSKYLNKCFFLTSDPFIRKKHQQFLLQMGVEKNETFYERMEKDKQRREAIAKANPTNIMQAQNHLKSSNGFGRGELMHNETSSTIELLGSAVGGGGRNSP